MQACRAQAQPNAECARRFTEDGFDLDLAYVTPRLIVLAAPQASAHGSPVSPAAASVPQRERDAPEEVARFLRQRHGGRYRLYDLTGAKEGLSPDPALLGEAAAVEAFRCEEPTPPLALLAAFCEDVDEYLRNDASGVAVLLCRDGAGRSGVLCAAHLVSAGATAEDALAAFAAARSRDGTLAFLPSQQRVVACFAAQRTRPLDAQPTPLRLTEVRIRLPANAVPPALRVWQRNAAGAAELLPWCLDARVSRSGADALYAFPPSTPPLAPGDFKLTLAMEARVGGAALGSAWLHTSFMPAGERFSISRTELDRPGAALEESFLMRLLFVAAPLRTPSRPSSPAAGLALPPAGRPRTPLSFKGAAAATIAARTLLTPGASTPPRPSTPRGASPLAGPAPPPVLTTPVAALRVTPPAMLAPVSPLSTPTGDDTPRRASVIAQMNRNVEAARREAAAEAETRRELHRCDALRLCLHLGAGSNVTLRRSKLQRLGAVLGNPQVTLPSSAAPPPSVITALAEAAGHIRSLADALSEERRVNAARQAQQAKHITALADALSTERRENAALRAQLETSAR